MIFKSRWHIVTNGQACCEKCQKSCQRPWAPEILPHPGNPFPTVSLKLSIIITSHSIAPVDTKGHNLQSLSNFTRILTRSKQVELLYARIYLLLPLFWSTTHEGWIDTAKSGEFPVCSVLYIYICSNILFLIALLIRRQANYKAVFLTVCEACA